MAVLACSAAPAPQKAPSEPEQPGPVRSPADAVAPDAWAPAQLPQAPATEPAAAPTAPSTAEQHATSVDPENRQEPITGEPELHTRARQLFDAIVSGDAALAEPFWFPKEPFVPLKAVDDPGKYWEQLHKSYLRDVRALHEKRKTWEGASFVRFEIGKKPKWVAPGQEANHVGYFRSLHGQLHYTLGGTDRVIDVHTVITWQGRWYVTHLGDFKH